MNRNVFKGAMAAVAAMVLGCAEIGRPPGGPIDTTPPTIVEAFPDSMATEVNPAESVRITFSEKVDKNSVRDWFFIRPHRRIEGIEWDGATASIRFRDGLPADSTISYFVGSGVLDRDGNRIQRPFRRTFSTGSSIAPGIVTGTIRRSRIETEVKPPPPGTTNSSRPGALGPAVYVWFYKALGDSLPDFSRDDPDYMTEADSDGHFLIDGLPLHMPLLAVTVQDGDRSRDYSDSRDYLTVQPDTLRFTDEVFEAAAALFYLIDPKGPGQISGHLAAPGDTSVVDTLSYGVLLSEASTEGEDLSWPPVRTDGSVMARAGAFTLTRIPPARYRIAVFIDLDGDGRWSLSEPLTNPLPVQVKAAEETGGIILPRPTVVPGN